MKTLKNLSYEEFEVLERTSNLNSLEEYLKSLKNHSNTVADDFRYTSADNLNEYHGWNILNIEKSDSEGNEVYTIEKDGIIVIFERRWATSADTIDHNDVFVYVEDEELHTYTVREDNKYSHTGILYSYTFDGEPWFGSKEELQDKIVKYNNNFCNPKQLIIVPVYYRYHNFYFVSVPRFAMVVDSCKYGNMYIREMSFYRKIDEDRIKRYCDNNVSFGIMDVLRN